MKGIFVYCLPILLHILVKGIYTLKGIALYNAHHYCPVKVDKKFFEIIEIQSFNNRVMRATI